MWISVGVALATSMVGVLIAALPQAGTARSARMSREMFLFGALLTLILLLGAAAMLLAMGGLAYLWFAKGILLLAGAFAVTCTAVGIVRGVRSGAARTG